MQQQRLQRFGGDLQNAGWLFEHPRLVGLGHIAVPVPHGDARLGTQVIRPQKLIVDQRLERADVDRPHRSGRILKKLGEDGEKGSLRLAGSGGGTQQHVVIGIENGIPRRHLNGTQRLPVIAVDEILHKGRIAVKYIHGAAFFPGCGRRHPSYSSNSAKSLPSVSCTAGVRA